MRSSEESAAAKQREKKLARLNDQINYSLVFNDFIQRTAHLVNAACLMEPCHA